MGAVGNLDLESQLARRLKAARVLSGKSAREVADEAGISKRKMWRFESGDQVPDALELDAIATATGQSVEYLLGRTSSEGNGPRTLPSPLPGVNLERAS